MCVEAIGGMFGVFFSDAGKITRYSQVVACDQARFRRFFHGMLERGIYLAPSAYEAGFVSGAHTPQDIDETLAAAREVLATL
jgi:glutamate-1-semialdehyde 2,1-aminomutase